MKHTAGNAGAGGSDSLPTQFTCRTITVELLYDGLRGSGFQVWGAVQFGHCRALVERRTAALHLVGWEGMR